MTFRPTRGVLLAFAVVLVTVGTVVPGVSWADSTPTVPAQPTATADHTALAEGDFVKVSGTGWGAPGPLVSVQVCGNAGINQSADCDLGGTAAGAIRPGGVFYTGLTIHHPPKNCPCVLRVYTVARPDDVRIPVTIQGIPTDPLVGEVGLKRRVVVSDVAVEGNGPWTSWFGAAPQRELVFTLTNTGDTLLHNPNVTLAWGRGSAPDGFIPPPQLGDLAPGQTSVVRVPIPMHALSIGTYTVTVDANPVGGESATGSADTTVVPWALLGLALILLQFLLIKARNWYRRRHRPPSDAPSDGDTADPADGSGVPAEAGSAPLDTTVASARRRSENPQGPSIKPRRLASTVTWAVGSVLAGTLLLAGCGSSAHDASPATVTIDPSCPLSSPAAQALLGGEATPIAPAPVGAAVAAPVLRCEYQVGTSTAQLTTFSGAGMAAQLKSILGKAAPAPDVGPSAYCEAHQGTTDGAVSCVFLVKGDTYVLAVSVPNSDLTPELQTKVRTLASVLVNSP